mgnify:CR=1 FL=1
MADGPMTPVEVCMEKLQASIDNRRWADCLHALSSLSTPYYLQIALSVHSQLDPALPIAPSLVKVGHELSLLLSFFPEKERATYALTVALYALTHLNLKENSDESQEPGPTDGR